jgi:hypothetical protein
MLDCGPFGMARHSDTSRSVSFNDDDSAAKGFARRADEP